MIGMQLPVREMLARLFLETSFDNFLLVEAGFSGDAALFLNGTRRVQAHPEGGDASQSAKNAPSDGFVSWGEIRPRLRAFFGQTLPESFRIVFVLSKEKTAGFLQAARAELSPEEVSGLYLNFNLSDGILKATSGAALTVFTMDKSLEKAWDRQLERFLERLSSAEARP